MPNQMNSEKHVTKATIYSQYLEINHGKDVSGGFLIKSRNPSLTNWFLHLITWKLVQKYTKLISFSLSGRWIDFLHLRIIKYIVSNQCLVTWARCFFTYSEFIKRARAQSNLAKYSRNSNWHKRDVSWSFPENLKSFCWTVTLQHGLQMGA